MRPTVYIETTVIGHLASRLAKDPRVLADMLATRRWWDRSRHRFELRTSDIVMEEISEGDPDAAAERLAVARPLTLLPIPSPAVPDLAELLLARHALPAKARVDAYHVAVSAANSINYMLTWNCRHLANAELRERNAETCREFGYNPPIICTPPELSEAPDVG
jgi:hypothetical protein